MPPERAEQPCVELVSLEGWTPSLVTEAFSHAFVRIANGLHGVLFLSTIAFTRQLNCIWCTSGRYVSSYHPSDPFMQ